MAFDVSGAVAAFRFAGRSRNYPRPTAVEQTNGLAEAFRQKTGRSLPPMSDTYDYTRACESSRDGVAPVCLRGPNGLVITSRGNEIRAVRR